MRANLRLADREYFIIAYESDPEAIARVVPEPLKPQLEMRARRLRAKPGALRRHNRCWTANRLRRRRFVGLGRSVGSDGSGTRLRRMCSCARRGYYGHRRRSWTRGCVLQMVRWPNKQYHRGKCRGHNHDVRARTARSSHVGLEISTTSPKATSRIRTASGYETYCAGSLTTHENSSAHTRQSQRQQSHSGCSKAKRLA